MGPLKTSSLIFMLTVQISVTLIAFYFLYKAATAPKRPEPDSYLENDDEE